jgi:hypothetical protein
MDRLADVEVQLVFQALDPRSKLRLSRCSRRLHVQGRLPVSWLHSPPVLLNCLPFVCEPPLANPDSLRLFTAPVRLVLRRRAGVTFGSPELTLQRIAALLVSLPNVRALDNVMTQGALKELASLLRLPAAQRLRSLCLMGLGFERFWGRADAVESLQIACALPELMELNIVHADDTLMQQHASLLIDAPALTSLHCSPPTWQRLVQLGFDRPLTTLQLHCRYAVRKPGEMSALLSVPALRRLRVLELHLFELSRPSSASLILSPSAAANVADDEWATIWQCHLSEVRSLHLVASGPPAALPLMLAHAQSVTLVRLQCRGFDAGGCALFIEGARALSVRCPWMSIELAVTLQPGVDAATVAIEHELGSRVRVITVEDG